MTLAAYAQGQGLSVYTMRQWRRKLAAQMCELDPAPKADSRTSAFVSLKVSEPMVGQPSSVTLTIAGEVRVQLSELPPPSWLAAVGLAMRGGR